MRLDAGGRVVREHPPRVLEHAAQQHCRARGRDRQHQGVRRRAAEHEREQPAERDEAGDADK